MTEPSGTASDSWSVERPALYRRLLEEGLDEDALHQLLVEKGSQLLDAAVPYMVVAARNRARTVARRDRRRVELEQRSWDLGPRQAVFDPADVVLARADLNAAVIELGRLAPSYSWPLWWHAAGFADAEIVELWNDAGFTPRDPTVEAIRKRRQRARAELRRHVLKRGDAGS